MSVSENKKPFFFFLLFLAVATSLLMLPSVVSADWVRPTTVFFAKNSKSMSRRGCVDADVTVVQDI